MIMTNEFRMMTSEEFYELKNEVMKEMALYESFVGKKYVIFPLSFGMEHNGIRLGIKDEVGNVKLVPEELLTEEMKNVIRKSDIRLYGKSMLLDDLEKEKDKEFDFKERMKELGITGLISLKDMRRNMARIYKEVNGKIVKIPVAYMNDGEIEFIVEYDKKVYGSGIVFLGYHAEMVSIKDTVHTLMFGYAGYTKDSIKLLCIEDKGKYGEFLDWLTDNVFYKEDDKTVIAFDKENGDWIKVVFGEFIYNDVKYICSVYVNGFMKYGFKKDGKVIEKVNFT